MDLELEKLKKRDKKEKQKRVYVKLQESGETAKER